MQDRDSERHSMFSIFWRNWITLLGSSITTASAFLILGFLLLGLLGIENAPYVGIIALLVLPGFFVGGLLLIPLGLLWDRRRRIKYRAETGRFAPYPKLDFNLPHVRKTAALVGFLTIVNVFIISTVSYQGVVFMDSVPFCGTVCHTVMEPEYTAYLHSPHAHVECVDCHIGPGAPWFVRSKLSGVGQLFAVTFKTYSTPIPTPVENLRPARETCEHCHWPQRFTGDRMKVLTKYSDDETNTTLKTVMLMHVGGGAASAGHGIHSWHIDPSHETTYFTTDPTRQQIDVVRVKNADGTETEFVADGIEANSEYFAKAEKRIMDCIDCHNRPTHIYQTPEGAMDEALRTGRIDATLPFIKQQGVAALKAAADEGKGKESIAGTLDTFYREKYPDLFTEKQSQIREAAGALEGMYARNIFPAMKVTWGTYPTNLGHSEAPGCFRCHDDAHTSADGKTISQDCTICHSVLAWDEENPAILQELGIQ